MRSKTFVLYIFLYNPICQMIEKMQHLNSSGNPLKTRQKRVYKPNRAVLAGLECLLRDDHEKIKDDYERIKEDYERTKEDCMRIKEDNERIKEENRKMG